MLKALCRHRLLVGIGGVLADAARYIAAVSVLIVLLGVVAGLW
jgi:hypothetical protein